MWSRTIGLMVILALGLLAAPLLANAQEPGKIPRIGYLRHMAGPNYMDEAFLQALRDLGWIEGKNIAFEYRWAAGKRERLPALAAELVRLKVDLIVVANTFVTQAAKNATEPVGISIQSLSPASERVAALAAGAPSITRTSTPCDSASASRGWWQTVV